MQALANATCRGFCTPHLHVHGFGLSLQAKPEVHCLIVTAVAGVCRVADFGGIELLEGDFESRLVNDQCQVYSCEVRGKLI